MLKEDVVYMKGDKGERGGGAALNSVRVVKGVAELASSSSSGNLGEEEAPLGAIVFVYDHDALAVRCRKEWKLLDVSICSKDQVRGCTS